MKNGVQLLAGIGSAVLGVLTFLTGHIRSVTVREMRADGPAAQFIAVLLLIMAVMILADWIKKFRNS
jgi:MFS superfamily sulfate permease-like transporter